VLPLPDNRSYAEKFLDKPANVSSEAETVISLLKKENAKTGFIEKLPANAGLPIWDKLIKDIPTSVQNEAARGVLADKYGNYLIPLSNDKITLSAVLFALYQEGNYYFYCYTNDYLYKMCYSEHYSVELREKALALFMYMSNYVFGINEFKNIPKNLFPDTKDISDTENTKYLTINPVKELAPDTTYIENLKFAEICIIRADPDHCTCGPGGCHDWQDGCEDCSNTYCYSGWTDDNGYEGGGSTGPAGPFPSSDGPGGGGPTWNPPLPPCPGVAWYAKPPGWNGQTQPPCNPPVNPCGSDGVMLDNECVNPSNYPGKAEGYPYFWWENEVWIDENISFDIDSENPPPEKRKLNAAEKEFVRSHPFAFLKIIVCANVAINESNHRYPGGSPIGRNDKADAFRHTYWMALCAAELDNSALAREYGEAHESDVPVSRALEKQMDLHNNNVGIYIRESSSDPNWQSLLSGVVSAMTFGGCKYIRPLNADHSLRTDSELHDTND